VKVKEHEVPQLKDRDRMDERERESEREKEKEREREICSSAPTLRVSYKTEKLNTLKF
jgi:hypothetical protein